MIQLTAEHTPAGTSYLATGQGHPVVLIHGVGLNKKCGAARSLAWPQVSGNRL